MKYKVARSKIAGRATCLWQMHRKAFGIPQSRLMAAVRFGSTFCLMILNGASSAVANPSPTINPDAVRSLQAAEAATSGMRGTDRAYAYWLISQSYSGFDRQAQLQTAIKSCEAAIAAEPESADFGLRQKVQLDCLRVVLALEPKVGRELLSRADAEVRQRIIAARAAKSARRGNVDKALELLAEEMSRASRYPYAEAMNTMRALPADDRAGRDRIFAQALTYYRVKNNRFDVGVDDLGTIVSRFWRDLSPGLVLEAIDTLLEVAKREVAESSHLEFSIVAGNDAAGLSSLYQYRILQLIPVLRALDPASATKLSESSAQMSSLLQKYPGGLSNLGSSESGTKGDFTMTLHIKGGPASNDFAAPDDLLLASLQQRAGKILEEARDDADQALRDALGLPDFPQRIQSFKADLILSIAAITEKKNQSQSINALRELVNVIKDYPPLVQSRYLAESGERYLRLKDKGSAAAVVELGMIQVAILYKMDANSDDPNEALKSSWPSTVAARAFVALAGKISMKVAEERIKELRDPDLQVFAQIQLASTLLKAPSYPALLQQRHKRDKDSFAAVFPIPNAEY